MGHIVTFNVQRRRPYKTGSIEPRGRGTYRLRVLVEDPNTHRLVRKSKTVHLAERGSKRQLEDELSRFRTEVAEAAVIGSKATLGALLDDWLEVIGRGDLAQNTVESYRTRVEVQIRPELGDIRLDKLTVRDIDRFYNRLSETSSPRTIQLTHSVLRSALQQAMDWGWLATNPAERAKRPRLRGTEKVALTPAQVAALYEAADDEPAIRAAIGLAATTGMRRGEIAGLKWSDIDPETGLLTIQRAWVSDDHGQHLSTTKNQRRRTIPLGTFGSNVLEAYRRHQVAAWGDELGEWVFSYYGDGTDPLSARAVTAYFARLAKRLGIKATFHDLRHFHQSAQLAGGVDVVTAARRAGHTPEVMLSTYAHGTPEQDAAAAEVVSGMLMAAMAELPPADR
jgi:integrase